MERVTLRKSAILKYLGAPGNGQVLQRLLEQRPGLKYGDYYEPHIAGDRFEVEFETTREGVAIVVLSEILLTGALSDKHHYVLRKADFAGLFVRSDLSPCCEDC
ncbi:MAG: hypothetical protein ACE5IQ_06645 [Candidatus Methylomirabilales bacterium]